MKENKVDIKLHGHLGEAFRPNWRLAVKSAGEAFHAINTLTNRFYDYLLKKDKEGAKYKVLINGRDFKYDEIPNNENPETFLNTELTMRGQFLKTIDVIPVLEGADGDIGLIILGVVLVIVGVFIPGIGGALIVAGLGLIAAGIINLLSSPPKFEDFRNISGGGKLSYLFNGPQNVTNEGGPVPVGYGRLLVGSQVIGASYEISNKDASTEALTT